MTILYNKTEKKDLRRWLRRDSTKPEQILWESIRANKLWVKFRRQYSVERYILDFYCVKKRLCIEIDGESYFSEEWKEYDKIRTEYLHAVWIKVLRFTNNEVMNNLKWVINEIQDKLI